MRRMIITSGVLLIAVVVITIMYFNNLNTPGRQSGTVLRNIPPDAALVFEFKDDTTVFDIFKNNHLFSTLMGTQKTRELLALRNALLQNEVLKPVFTGKSIFISIHPKANANDVEYLLSTSGSANLQPGLDRFAGSVGDSLKVKAMSFNGKPGYAIYFKAIGKTLYVVINFDNTLIAGFSNTLVQTAAAYRNEKQLPVFEQLSDQQNSNSIVNLYVNYLQLQPLVSQLFINKDPEIFRAFRQLAAVGSLSLNYKTDAIMFNGVSHINTEKTAAYLNLFAGQNPCKNTLKEVFPGSTAFSINFAVSDPVKFQADLAGMQHLTGADKEKRMLLNRVKQETGADLVKEFKSLLGNEFAIVTTKYQEKIAIVQLKNGSYMKPVMQNISAMSDADAGLFNYDKLPLYLLGDDFGIFRRPYFMVADNYLILCSSLTGLKEYYRNYVADNFLRKSDDYVHFDNLQAESSNVSFYINFKNSADMLRQQLKPAFAKVFDRPGEGWNNYYGASYQLTSVDHDFYTNFYMRVNQVDTASLSR